MTFAQGTAFCIVAVMMALFVWGRLRYDVVAMLALLAAVLTGIGPAKEAFSGFSDDVVIIVAAALLVSAAVAKSGVTEDLIRPLAPHLRTARSQVFVLVLSVIALSTFIKNVGAIMMPVALQLAKRSGHFAFAAFDAARFRLAAGRPHYADRDLAERDRLPGA